MKTDDWSPPEPSPLSREDEADLEWNITKLFQERNRRHCDGLRQIDYTAAIRMLDRLLMRRLEPGEERDQLRQKLLEVANDRRA